MSAVLCRALPFARFLSVIAAIALSIAASGCDDAKKVEHDDDADVDGGEMDAGPDVPAVTADAVATYAEIVEASYKDSLTKAEALDTAIQGFLDDPIPYNWGTARVAWLDAREPYLQTEVYRFYDGPIDNPTDGPEGLMNSWPLDEKYIDYVQAEPAAGIVNDTSKTISVEKLMELNEKGGEKNIATGYHAIEFLLWGQDFNDEGPGDRPYTDYIPGGAGTHANQARRGQYLTAVSSLLVGNLEDLVAAWEPNKANYRGEFEDVAPAEGLRRILTGMIVLSGFETGGERIQTAIDSGEQEDEHSCFSDNTHRDMIQDIQGILNVWKGTYTKLDDSKIEGTGIEEVVRADDPELADALDAKIQEALDNANALEPPFDQEIKVENTAGHARLQALAASLHELEGLLEDVFRNFGLTIPQPE